MTTHKRSLNFFSSFTFKIVAAMMLAAVLPAAFSLFIFERINSFNQNLQQEAVISIDAASDVYRSLIKSESERMRLVEQNLSLEVKDLLQKHQIKRPQKTILNSEFREELKLIFDHDLQEYDLISAIDFTLNGRSLVSSRRTLEKPENYQFRTSDIPITLHSRSTAESEPDIVEEFPEIPMLIAEPVESNDANPGAYPSLPETLPVSDNTNDSSASKRGIHLSVVFAIEKAQHQSYERLGDRRHLHDSISTVENDGGMRVTEIYQTYFMTVAIIVIILSLILALQIALSLSRRVSTLTNSMRSLADGDLNAKVEVKGNDQVSFMMTQFNHMVDDVRTAQESKAYIERTKAWREVARRLAHEIKNPLTPISLSIQQLDKKFDDYLDNPKKYRKLLTDAVEIVNEETETLKKLVKNFTEFARMPIPEMKPGIFYDFVTQTVHQNPQFEESAKRITVHSANPDIASASLNFDAELMRRVIVNIVRNGIEAAQNADIEPEIDIEVLPVDPQVGAYSVCLRISDNGPGLTEDQKSKLFMPYFTTKSNGTGLGLSIVRKIVEDHNGRITLQDREDHARGTQVDILL